MTALIIMVMSSFWKRIVFWVEFTPLSGQSVTIMSKEINTNCNVRKAQKYLSIKIGVNPSARL